MTDVKGMSEEGGVDYMLEYDALAERLARYRKAFEHYHVNAQDGTDACKQCGLDLFDEIHKRSL